MPGNVGDRGVDQISDDLYDLDFDDAHNIKVVKVLKPGRETKEYKEKLKAKRLKHGEYFFPKADTANAIQFRTVGRGRNRRVVAFRRTRHWRSTVKQPKVKPDFPGTRLVGSDKDKGLME